MASPGWPPGSAPTSRRWSSGSRRTSAVEGKSWSRCSCRRPHGFGVSSADAYAWWDERAATGPDPGALIAAAEAGNDELLGSALYNDLQGPVAARHPEIAEAVAAFADVGARGAVMSGSGPTVVALCSFASAQDVADAVPGSFVVDAPPRPPTPATIDPDPSGVV